MSDAHGGVLRRQLEASLLLLAAESPQHWARLRAELSSLRVRACVATEPPFETRLTGEPPWLRDATGPGDVELALDARTVDAFLHGSLTLEPALRSGALELRGSLQHMRRLLSAFDAWLHGLLRAPGSGALYRDLCKSWPPLPSASRDAR